MKKITIVLDQDGEILGIYDALKSKVRAAFIAREKIEVGAEETREMILNRIRALTFQEEELLKLKDI